MTKPEDSTNSEKKPAKEFRRAQFAQKQGEIVLRPHEYDGIQEFDQKLPNWWLFTFFAAVAFGLIYWISYYHTRYFQSDPESVTAAMSEIHQKKSAALEAALAELSDEVLVHKWATDPAMIAEGQTIYSQVCIGCHGPNLDSPMKLGLSLVDGEWKYGSKPLDIFKIINEGTPPDSKGMPPAGARMAPWGQTYSPKQIAQLTAFIISKNSKDFADY